MESNDKRLIEILERMPDNLTDMQKVRYVYIEVCKFFTYNPEYVIGDDKRKEELFDQDIDIHEMMNNQAICSSLSRAVIYLLKELDFVCNGVYFNIAREGHLEVIVEVDGEIYELDPARDLMNVKMGLQTVGFATKMYTRSTEDFWGYSDLTEEQIKKLDDALGYTFGLSKKYIETIDERGEKVEDYDFRMYMDEAIEKIGNALYNKEQMNEYIESIHPEVDIQVLTANDYDRYRIEFLMNYVNNFAKDHSYIDRRDFFEHLVNNAMNLNEGEFIAFSGTDPKGDLYTIMKYKGKIVEYDLFYLVREGMDIKELSVDEVKLLLEGGFKTISKGKEKKIFSVDGPFRVTTYEYGQEINSYIDAAETEEEMIERKAEAYAAITLQRVRMGIAYYKEAVFYSKSDPNSAATIKGIYASFIKFVTSQEYDKYIPKEDIDNPDIGIPRLLDDMELIERRLIEKAGPVLQMIEDYKQALKEEAIVNNYLLYHVSTRPPEEMEGGELRPHHEKTQFHQEFGEILCGSTQSVNSNPYILARVNGNKGMYRLPIGNNSYLLQGHNVSVVTDENGNKRAVSNIPGYVYYMPIDQFEPVVILKYDTDRGEYFYEFEEEWVTDHPIKIPEQLMDPKAKLGETKSYPESESAEVFAIEEYRDVTPILEHNHFVINNELGKSGIDLLTKNTATNMHITYRIMNMIRDKQITYLNAEAGVNAHKDAADAAKIPLINYDAEDILYGPSVVTTEEVRVQKQKIREFVENALHSKGVTYGDYMQIMSMRLPEDKENKTDKEQNQS